MATGIAHGPVEVHGERTVQAAQCRPVDIRRNPVDLNRADI